MTREEETLYGEYFSACRQKFTNLNPSPPLGRIVDPSFYSVMESAIGTEKPWLLYDNSPLATRLLFSIINLLPRPLGDTARLKLMLLPNFLGK